MRLCRIAENLSLSTCPFTERQSQDMQVLAALAARKPVAAGDTDDAVSAARYASMLSRWAKLQEELAGLTEQCLLQEREAEVRPLPASCDAATFHLLYRKMSC